MSIDKKIVFVRTKKGSLELAEKNGALFGDLKRVMLLIDDKATLGEISKRAVPSLRAVLFEVVTQLQADGYIRDKDKSFAEPHIATPKSVKHMVEELDFTTLVAAPVAGGDKQKSDAEATQKKADAGIARAELEAAVEAAKAKAREEAETKAQSHAKLSAEVAARNKAEGELRDKHDALLKAKAEAKSTQESEARVHAEQVAAQVRLELEAAEKARAEAEALAQQQIEAAAHIKAQAEEQARQEAEAARLREEQDAARVKAELDAAAKAKAEAEAARVRAEEHAKAEAAARLEAETVRLREQQEAARVKAELEAAEKAKAEADAARSKAEEEAGRIRAELEVAKAQAEAEAKALAEKHARQKTEEAHARAEAAARLKAEQALAQAQAVIDAKLLAEERAKEQADAERLRVEQEAARDKLAREEAEAARLNAEQETARVLAELDAVKVAEEKASSAQQKQDITTQTKRVEQLKNDAALEAVKQGEVQETQRLADEQEKKWAAAELRAKAQTSLKATHPAQAPVESAEPVSVQRTKPRRKPFPAGKVAAALLVLILSTIALLPYVMPLDSYIPAIEKKLSVQFKQAVHVGSLHVELFPRPTLKMGKVSIGDRQELKVANVAATFSLTTLFSESKRIREVELRDVVLEANAFDKEVAWLQAIGESANYSVQHVTVSNAKIASEKMLLPVFNGEVLLNEKGHVSQLILKSADAKFDVDLQQQRGHWEMLLNASKTSLPIFPNVQFEDLSVKGEIVAGEINILELKGQAYGGFLHGNAKLKWRQGWQLLGHVEATSIELSKLFPKYGVSGALAGSYNYLASSDSLDKLTDSPKVNGSFLVQKGSIEGVDMVEVVRQRVKQGVASGSTRFDELAGDFQTNKNVQRVQNLKIFSGILHARGSFNVRESEQLAGQLSVELKAQPGSSKLKLSGTLTEPVLELKH